MRGKMLPNQGRDQKRKMGSSYDEKRVRNKEIATRRAELWVKETNSRFNEFVRLLFTAGFAIFTVTSPVVVDLKLLDCPGRTLLIGSWLLDLVSLIFGFFSIHSDARFYSRLKKIESESERIWSNPCESNEGYNQALSLDHQNRANTPEHSNLIFLALQAFSLFISVLLILTIGIRLITAPSYTQENSINQQFSDLLLPRLMSEKIRIPELI